MELDNKIDVLSQETLKLNKLIKKSTFFNVRLYYRFNRFLEPEHIDHILNKWCPALDLHRIDAGALGYIAHRVCQIESMCKGRLAVSIQDAVFRVLVAQSIVDEDLEILEIGSLFGINLAILYDNCGGRFEAIHLTAIDPLDGYYKTSLFDIVTNTPINRDTFEHNMRISGVKSEAFTLVQKLSTEERTLARVGKKSYNFLIIDGDHSYNGIKFDFENYLPMVRKGGYIIFDDYNSDEWPDVSKYINFEVKNNKQVKYVGNEWRTAIFRKK